MASKEGKGGSTRGFAGMDERKQREIASKGGQSVPPHKRSFAQKPELAAEAGRKGGESVPPWARSFARNPQLAAEAGRKGGHASHSAQRTQSANGGKKRSRARKETPLPDQAPLAERPAEKPD